MGLLDILNGMQNGPRGQSVPGDSAGQGGMSPMTMAILALLAYKAVKHIGGGPSGGNPAPTPAPSPNTVNAGLPGGLGGAFGGGGLGGGLGNLLKGGLGGLLAGGAAGSVISGGLGDLLKQFQDSGHGDTANSWVSPGPNKEISPNDLGRALGADQINTLSSQTGLSRDELLAGLSQHLPDVINQLTPHGRLPHENEVSI
ncbi:YidB family protein [uncultured Bradyrhizobium sp.]|uniref:YidB family protein n=1 Tax=uncultured Bradyrhizobium sp. TaxID=199684 RepID=UPI0035C9E595